MGTKNHPFFIMSLDIITILSYKLAYPSMQSIVITASIKTAIRGCTNVSLHTTKFFK
jgi:hypothetical protein